MHTTSLQVDKLTVLDTHKMLKAGHGSMRHSGTASFLRHSMFQINPSELLPNPQLEPQLLQDSLGCSLTVSIGVSSCIGPHDSERQGR